MVIADALKKHARQAIGPALGALVVAYIAYHAVQGDRGLLAYFTYSQEVERAKAALGDIQRTRERLEHRVALLRPDSLDPDLLDKVASTAKQWPWMPFDIQVLVPLMR